MLCVCDFAHNQVIYLDSSNFSCFHVSYRFNRTFSCTLADIFDTDNTMPEKVDTVPTGDKSDQSQGGCTSRCPTRSDNRSIGKSDDGSGVSSPPVRAEGTENVSDLYTRIVRQVASMELILTFVLVSGCEADEKDSRSYFGRF